MPDERDKPPCHGFVCDWGISLCVFCVVMALACGLAGPVWADGNASVASQGRSGCAWRGGCGSSATVNEEAAIARETTRAEETADPGLIDPTLPEAIADDPGPAGEADSEGSAPKVAANAATTADLETAGEFHAGSGPHAAVDPDVGDAQPQSEDFIDTTFEFFNTEQLPGIGVELYWKRGMNYVVREGEFLRDVLGYRPRLSGRIGLQLHVDAAGYATGGIQNVRGGIDLRRLYFSTTGELDLAFPILFAIDLGVQKGSFFVDDAYIWITDIPYIGTFKIGQFTAPMSLARLTSSNTRPFMELGTPAEAFAPGSRTGFQVASNALLRRLTWQLGWFIDAQSDPVGDATQSSTRLVGRVTGLPLLEQRTGSQRLLHIGVSSSFVLSNEKVRYQSRPESYLAPLIVDTGEIEASNASLLAFEGAWVDGPLSFQSEVFGSWVNQAGGDTPFLFGLYGYGSWFLTGESRPFNLASAAFGAVVPRDPVSFRNWSFGAWELAGRLSYTDLNSGAVRGGKVFTMMTGLNWYWSRYGRMLFEYGYSRARQGPQEGGLHIFQMRFQVNI